MTPPQPPPPLAARLPAVLAAVARRVPGTVVDQWRPPVQGAVGMVVGVRGPDGSARVLKVHPVRDRLRTEVAALDLASRSGWPVPTVVASGELDEPGGPPVGFILMTRLPGDRWADRRSRFTPSDRAHLVAEVGRSLRRLHRVPGPGYGELGRPGSLDAATRTSDGADERLAAYVRAGGEAVVADRVRGFVADRRPVLARCPGPVLCHHDFIGGNLLVTGSHPPRLSGVVDLERAAWDDPLTDLALTRRHVRQHEPDDVAALTAAYGDLAADEQERLAVHELLSAVAERAWVARDRPAGWLASLAALDREIEALLARSG